jgi:hypothetical protein
VTRYYNGTSVGTRTVVRVDLPAFALLEYDGSGWADLHTPSATDNQALWMSPSGVVHAGFTGGPRMLRLRRNILTRMPGVWLSGGASSIQARAQNDVLLTASNVQHYNGTSWSQITAVDTFYDTTKDPAGNIFAISFEAGLLKPNGPNAWTIATTPTGNALAAVATNDLWIIDASSSGPSNRSVSRWLNGTTSSPPSITPMLGASEVLVDIWGASPTDVYVASNIGNVFRFAGSSWSVAWTAPDPVELLWGLNSASIYAVTTTGTVQHYDGSNVTSAKVTDDNVYALWGTADNDLFIATSHGVLHFDGTQWAPTAIATPYAVYSMTGAGDSAFFADFGHGVSQLVRTGTWAH